MKKAISIALAIVLAVSLAVTALAADITTPPTGENVVKLTDASNGEEYNGDIYLEFSNPVKVTIQGTDEYIEVPAGTTVTLYWFKWDTYQALAGNAVYSAHFKKGVNYVSNSENADGTISVTFDAEGDYEFEGISPVSGLWLFELTPHIHVTGSAASTEPTEPTDPTDPGTPAQPIFPDVPNGCWFTEMVKSVVDAGIMTARDGMFEPGAIENLSDVVAVLKAIDPEKAEDLFTGEDKAATREDMVVMFWKHAGCPTPASSTAYILSAFVDGDTVDNATAWAWAVEAGIIVGTDIGLEPNLPLPRSHLATLAVQYMEYREWTKHWI